mmetsp:Transcript_36971/g.68494  ORF Transcript_36971/g.68494 Transcript_36971/m.68494 type:complete len:204 (-) Transcript_36971:13-624(-)
MSPLYLSFPSLLQTMLQGMGVALCCGNFCCSACVVRNEGMDSAVLICITGKVPFSGGNPPAALPSISSIVNVLTALSTTWLLVGGTNIPLALMFVSPPSRKRSEAFTPSLLLAALLANVIFVAPFLFLNRSLMLFLFFTLVLFFVVGSCPGYTVFVPRVISTMPFALLMGLPMSLSVAEFPSLLFAGIPTFIELLFMILFVNE